MMVSLIAFIVGFVVVAIIMSLRTHTRSYAYDPISHSVNFPKLKTQHNLINTRELIAEFDAEFEKRNIPKERYFTMLAKYCFICKPDSQHNINPYFRSKEVFMCKTKDSSWPE